MAQHTLNWNTLTKYERTKIIGWRAEMLARGAPPLLSRGDGGGGGGADLDLRAALSPVDVARRELESGSLPFLVRRVMPDGTTKTLKLEKNMTTTDNTA